MSKEFFFFWLLPFSQIFAQPLYNDCGIIGDAGSTGTRIYVAYDLMKAPKILTIGKQQGGLAKVGAEVAFYPPNGGKGISVLLSEAHKKIGELGCVSSSGKFPLAILGTAGTRVLGLNTRAAMWEKLTSMVKAYVEKQKLSLNVVALETISGESEGTTKSRKKISSCIFYEVIG